MKRSIIGAFGLIFWATISPAKVVTLNFDIYDDPEFDGRNGYCVTESAITHCEGNRDSYGWSAGFKFLSDYDFFAGTNYVADPGFLFDPIGFDILFSDSQVWRALCDESATPAACRSLDYGYEERLRECDMDKSCPPELEIWEYPYLELRGYADGELVATLDIDPDPIPRVVFPSTFTGLDRLYVGLRGSWFESAEVLADGNVYTCLPNRYYYCNEMGYNNFQIAVYEAVSQPAPIPVPGGLILMSGGFSLLAAATARGRRAR